MKKKEKKKIENRLKKITKASVCFGMLTKIQYSFKSQKERRKIIGFWTGPHAKIEGRENQIDHCRSVGGRLVGSISKDT